MGIDRILIADSDYAFVNRLKKGLEQFGQFVVLTAPDGKHALRLLKTQKVSLVIADIDLPKLDGLELLAAMTRKHPNILSIISTSLHGAQLKKETRGESLFSYLNKPYDHVKLHSEIIKVLDCLDEIQFKPGIYPSSLLPLIHIRRKTCLLEVQGSGSRKGSLSFFDGLLCDAVQDNLTGRKAVEEMFRWDPCKYWFRDPDDSCTGENINEELTRLVLKLSGASFIRPAGKKPLTASESPKKSEAKKFPVEKKPHPQPVQKAPGKKLPKPKPDKKEPDKKAAIKKPEKTKPHEETPLEKKLREVLAEMPTRLGPGVIKQVVGMPTWEQFVETTNEKKQQPVPVRRKGPSNVHRVVIVDDSSMMRDALRKTLSTDSSLEIVGEAQNRREALDIIKKEKPDVVTLDIQIPRSEGLSTLKQMMIHSPTPTIILSSVAFEGAAITFDMLKYGAVDFMAKPTNIAGEDVTEKLHDIIRRIHLAADIKIESAKYIRTVDNGKKNSLPVPTACRKIVCMGAGEGGYSSLLKIIPKLACDIPAAYFVVLNVKPQHVDAFAGYLDRHCTVRIQRAANGLPIESGTCFIASSAEQVSIKEGADGNMRIQITKLPSWLEGKSINTLMFSLADHYKKEVIGVILSGSGIDGTEGLKEIKSVGGMAIIQNPDFCLQKEMVLSAREHVNKHCILSESKIAETINRICGQK